MTRRILNKLAKYCVWMFALFVISFAIFVYTDKNLFGGIALVLYALVFIPAVIGGIILAVSIVCEISKAIFSQSKIEKRLQLSLEFEVGADSYFDGNKLFHFSADLDILQKSYSEEFIAETCKIFINNGFFVYLVYSLTSPDDEEKMLSLDLEQCDIMDVHIPYRWWKYYGMSQKRMKGKLALMSLPEDSERSAHILRVINKFVENINWSEYPFIAFSKIDYPAFLSIIESEKTAIANFAESPVKSGEALRIFTNRHRDKIAALLTIFDNKLTLLARQDAVEVFSDILRANFEKYIQEE